MAMWRGNTFRCSRFPIVSPLRNSICDTKSRRGPDYMATPKRVIPAKAGTQKQCLRNFFTVLGPGSPLRVGRDDTLWFYMSGTRIRSKNIQRWEVWLAADAVPQIECEAGVAGPQRITAAPVLRQCLPPLRDGGSSQNGARVQARFCPVSDDKASGTHIRFRPCRDRDCCPWRAVPFATRGCPRFAPGARGARASKTAHPRRRQSFPARRGISGRGRVRRSQDRRRAN